MAPVRLLVLSCVYVMTRVSSLCPRPTTGPSAKNETGWRAFFWSLAQNMSRVSLLLSNRHIMCYHNAYCQALSIIDV
jgi:hypothetical protein